MKAILEFNLSEEQSEYELANKASKLYCALWNIEQQIRQWRKYESKESLSIDELANKFYDIVGELLE